MTVTRTLHFTREPYANEMSLDWPPSVTTFVVQGTPTAGAEAFTLLLVRLLRACLLSCFGMPFRPGAALRRSSVGDAAAPAPADLPPKGDRKMHILLADNGVRFRFDPDAGSYESASPDGVPLNMPFTADSTRPGVVTFAFGVVARAALAVSPRGVAAGDPAISFSQAASWPWDPLPLPDVTHVQGSDRLCRVMEQTFARSH